MRKLTGVLALVLTGAGRPALAECTGQGCYDGLLIAVLSLLVYACVGLAILVMLLRAKWRRSGVQALIVVLALAVGVPLLSQGWQVWKQVAMERREVAGQPPSLAGRGVLLIPQGEVCHADACMSVLIGRGEAGAFVLPVSTFAGLDLSQPIALADLPLQHWRAPGTTGIEPLRRSLSAEERRAAAATIDYVILTAEPFYLSEPGPVEAALRTHPALGRLGAGEILRLGMGPLEQSGTLALTKIRFDLLDLWLVDPALAIPLAPGHWQSARNTTAGLEAATQTLCAVDGGEIDWGCRSGLE